MDDNAVEYVPDESEQLDQLQPGDSLIDRGVDVLIADTAGLLHTKDNLMEELMPGRPSVGARPCQMREAWCVCSVSDIALRKEPRFSCRGSLVVAMVSARCWKRADSFGR